MNHPRTRFAIQELLLRDEGKGAEDSTSDRRSSLFASFHRSLFPGGCMMRRAGIQVTIYIYGTFVVL